MSPTKQDDIKNPSKLKSRKPSISLEVELQRGKSISRLVLFVRNESNSPYTFATGARGGSGSLDDGFRFNENPKTKHRESDGFEVIGTAPTIVPEFDFRSIHHHIRFKAPTMGGPTRRSMRPFQATVPEKSRLLYASFAVPNHQVSGEFVEARLKIKDRVYRTKTIKIKKPPADAKYWPLRKGS